MKIQIHYNAFPLPDYIANTNANAITKGNRLQIQMGPTLCLSSAWLLKAVCSPFAWKIKKHKYKLIANTNTLQIQIQMQLQKEIQMDPALWLSSAWLAKAVCSPLGWKIQIQIYFKN